MQLQKAWRMAMGMAVLAFAGSASAQISLSTAVDLALKNDPRVKMAQADVKKSEGALDEARAAFIPSFGVEGGYGKSTGAPLGLPTVFSFSSQSLIFNFSQRDNIRAAASSVRSAKLQLQEVQDQVSEDVVNTYISLDHAEQKQAAMKDETQAASRLTQIVQDRLDAGQDTKIELLRAQRTLAQIKLSALQAGDDVEVFNDHLSRVMGLPGTRLATVPQSIPPITPMDIKPDEQPVSFGVRSAFSNAQSKQEIAFGTDRYLYRPQVILVGNYSRLNTSPSQSNFLDYYPDFKGKTNNDAAIAMQIQIPLFDRSRVARSREAAADAAHTLFEAQNQKSQFLEGRFKLRHSTEELMARSEVAGLDQQIAQEQLNTILIQLNSSGSDPNATQLTPKDEQNARLQERQRYVDLLQAQMDLREAQVNLMRQTGKLDDWLKQNSLSPAANGTVIH
jgi:outer membrane protein TolC